MFSSGDMSRVSKGLLEVLLYSFSFDGSDMLFYFFFFNDTATTEIYTLSLHDALPIYRGQGRRGPEAARQPRHVNDQLDRKSTRLNSSHGYISYAVFCLKKKK